MLQAFIITLREGDVADRRDSFCLPDKIGGQSKRTGVLGAGSAVVGSIGVAVVVAHTAYNSDVVEGWVMLAAAVFVISVIWFMHKAAGL
jgi:hypothetical protein